MKKLVLLSFISLSSLFSQAQLYSSSSSEVSFDSKTPMEDIHAETVKAKAALKLKTKKVLIKIKMISFKFEKPLMEEHFNEKYVESEKYPNATFSGVIDDDIDLTKEGTYQVKVTGKLLIHGVEQLRTLTGTVAVSEGKIDLTTKFKINLKDHKIKIPKVVVKNIAETVDVSAHFVCKPFVKKNKK